jgi:exosome complex RNA-binding protein Csl4
LSVPFECKCPVCGAVEKIKIAVEPSSAVGGAATAFWG